jgi:Uma2 family endonuclease
MPKSPLHRLLVRRLFDLLCAALPPGYVVNKEDPLSTPTSEPEPDISVVRGRSEDYGRHHPATAELVIEVAVTTEEVDFGKALIYAEAGVKEYWIVEPEKQCLTAFRGPKGRAYEQSRRYEGAAMVTSTALPGLEVALSALFAEAA